MNMLGVMVTMWGLVAAVESSEAQRPFVQEVATVFTTAQGLPEGVVSAIWFGADGAPVAQLPQGTFRYDGKNWVSASANAPKIARVQGTLPVSPEAITAQAHRADSAAIGCADGLYLRPAAEKKWTKVYPADAKYSWAPRNVRVLVYDSKGRLWFGSDEGVGLWDGSTWKLFTGKEGLPYNRFTCAIAGEDGAVWFGTEKGAIRADGERFAFRANRRWLAGEKVTSIAVEPNGTAWIATDGGVSRIERKPMTLDAKAAYFVDQVEKRHVRMGYVADCRLREQYVVDSWQPKLTDNDGMYTSMYGAAQSFRYAVTGDPEAKALAKRTFEACKALVDVTAEVPGMRGFPARVLIPADWPENVNEEYGAAYNERKRKRDPFWKMILPRYVKTSDGKFMWKCDTSSDELAGHYLFYGVYYDLVAQTEEEKKPVREVVRDITDHLIRNGYLLRDHDGEPTRWGNFSPEYLNSPYGWEARPLNSLMMLSFLNVAAHVTGDAKYERAAKELRDKHHYHINAMAGKFYFPPSATVPWDNNLGLFSYYGLMKYEKDPELLLMYRESVDVFWLYVSRQKNALWNTIYGALAKDFSERSANGATAGAFPELPGYAERAAKRFADSDPRMGDAVEMLRGIPLDLIGYRMDNTYRLDVVLDPTPGAEEKTGWHFDGRALPIEELGHVRQDRSSFDLDQAEDSGYAEHEGTFFLLPYYMARYHGLI